MEFSGTFFWLDKVQTFVESPLKFVWDNKKKYDTSYPISKRLSYELIKMYKTDNAVHVHVYQLQFSQCTWSQMRDVESD